MRAAAQLKFIVACLVTFVEWVGGGGGAAKWGEEVLACKEIYTRVEPYTSIVFNPS
jgi:hypothetical protein